MPKNKKKLTREELEKQYKGLLTKHGNYELSTSEYHRSGDFSDIFDKQEKALWNKIKKKVQNEEVEALAAGPAGSDPQSMLEWLHKWPRIYDHTSLLKKHQTAYSDEMYEMGFAWFAVFGNDQARSVLLAGGGIDNIESSYLREQYQIFLNSYQRLCGNLQKDAAEEPDESEPDELVRNETQKHHSVSNEPDVFSREKQTLDDFATKLEKAQTTFGNSNEYKRIFNTIKLLNKTEFPKVTGIPQEGEMSRNQTQAIKLFMIKDIIDAYLTHKGKDGVKQNVYHKLAAVEELNQYICQQIHGLVDEKFTYAGKDYDPAKARESLAAHNTHMTLSQDDMLQKFPNYVLMASTKQDEYQNNIACMGRIIQKAKDNGQSEQKIRDLENMRQAFKDNPNPVAAPTQAAPKAVDKTAAPPNHKLASSAAEAIQKGKKLLKIQNKKIVEATAKLNQSHKYTDQEAMYYRYVKNYVSLTADQKQSLKNSIETDYKDIMSASSKALDHREDSFGINFLFDDCQTIAKNHINAHMDDFTKLADNDLTDSQLIDQWPELNVKLGCFKGIFKDEYDWNPNAKKVIDKYDQLQTRIKELAAPALEKEKQRTGHI